MLVARSAFSNQGLRILGARSVVSLPPNEPPTNLNPDSNDLKELQAEIQRIHGECLEIPCVVGGKEIYTGNTGYQMAPYNHSLKIAKYHMASEEVIKEAIHSAMAARRDWERTPLEHRAAIFQKVADLITGKYRIPSLAVTMVGQAKTAFEADIDCVQEIADFYRFGIHYAKELQDGVELHQTKGVINQLKYRGLEGFVAAISPFNFTAIGGNLAGTPAIVGNVVLWKPALTTMLASYLVYRIFQEAGVPDGVVNFIPSSGKTFGDVITASPHLAGINFTGSVETFRYIWRKVAENIDIYRTFPRLIGECGGKNFHFLHESADIDTVVNCTIRAAYGYSGQKCSACSRIYVPESKWAKVKELLIQKHKELKMGSPEDYDTFVSAVIDEKSYKNIKEYIDYAKDSSDLSIIAGGKCDDSVGYFVEPTIIETKRPDDKLMNEEIFGPVLTVYVYPDQKSKETLQLVDKTSPFALTGSIFARDRYFIQEAADILKDAAGNFYINDKSTGSVVGQQPFGGARLSGTNDKAGSSHYILRWVSPQSVKETVVPIDDYKYPHQS